MKQWVRRAAQLHDELAGLADVRDPRWWVVAAAGALDWTRREAYLTSDAEPSSDTFIGSASAAPNDIVADAITRAHAARQALRELDTAFPQQPLAIVIERGAAGAICTPSALHVAAFAIGDRCWCAPLADRLEDEPALAADLASALAGRAPAHLVPLDAARETPFVCISIGDEPIETARHGHRRAWTTATGPRSSEPANAGERDPRSSEPENAGERGPWLGLGRARGLALASTCHLAVDGYGHTRVASRIAELTATSLPRAPRTVASIDPLPPLARVRDSIELAVTYRSVPPGLRALPIGYALGCVLYEIANDPHARFSPTFQIPIAPGAHDDPTRVRRRVVPAIASVRFSSGKPEPFKAFATRTRDNLVREAEGDGLVTRLLAAARAVPAPLAWKRRAIGAERPGWLDPIATVVGGRGCVSRIELDVPTPPSCAVSSPARLATPADPLGGCVVTVIDDGERAAITLCGSGEVAREAVLDQLLARCPS